METRIKTQKSVWIEQVREGADVIDIGGQSTRPNAGLLSAEEELERVMPVLTALAAEHALRDIPISIDTFHSSVARAAVGAGARVVNDISAGRFDPEMFATVC